MAETIRDVVVRVSIKTGSVDLKVPEIKGLTREAEALPKAIDTAYKKLGKEFDLLSESHIKLQDQFRKMREGTEDFGRKVEASQRQATSAVLGTFDAVMQLGRGILFLTVSNQDDLARVVKSLLVFEGVFNIFRGGITIMESTARAIRVTRTANVALATSNTAVAVTGRAATGSMIALGAVTIPVTAAFLAIGVAIAGVAGTFAFLSHAEKKEQEELENTQRRVVALHRAYIDLFEIRGQIEVSRVSRIAGLLPDLNAEGETSRADKLAEQMELLRKTARQVQIDRGFALRASAGRGASAADLAQIEIDAHQKLVGIERQRFSLQQEISDSKRRALETERTSLEMSREALGTAQQRLELEQQKTRSVEAQLGRLDPETQRFVLSLLDRAAAGDTNFNRTEVGALRQSGVATELVERIDVRRGRQASRGRDLSEADVGDLVSVQAEVNRITEATGGQEQIVTDLADVNTKLEDLAESQHELLVNIINSLARQDRQLNEMRTSFNRNHAG